MVRQGVVHSELFGDASRWPPIPDEDRFGPQLDDDVPAAQASSAEAAEDDAEDSMGELQSMVEHLGAIQVVTTSWQTKLRDTRFADALRDDLDAFAVRLAMLTSNIQSFAWDEAEVTSAAENFLKIAKELVDEYTMFKGAMTPFESTE